MREDSECCPKIVGLIFRVWKVLHNTQLGILSATFSLALLAFQAFLSKALSPPYSPRADVVAVTASISHQTNPFWAFAFPTGYIVLVHRLIWRESTGPSVHKPLLRMAHSPPSVVRTVMLVNVALSSGHNWLDRNKHMSQTGSISSFPGISNWEHRRENLLFENWLTQWRTLRVVWLLYFPSCCLGTKEACVQTHGQQQIKNREPNTCLWPLASGAEVLHDSITPASTDSMTYTRIFPVNTLWCLS